MQSKIDRILNKKWAAAVGGVLCAFLWGTVYPVIKYYYAAFGVDSVADKLMFAGTRFMTAGVMVFIAAWIIGRRLPRAPRAIVAPMILNGLMQSGLMYILNYIGVSHTSATKTSILTAATAFFAVLLAPLFFRDERLTALRFTGALIGFAGIVIVNLSDIGGGMRFDGEGLLLIATVLNTAGSFVGKRISPGYVFEVTAYELLSGSALILAVGLLMGGCVSLAPEALLLTLYLAFVSAAAFTLWTALLARHDAGRVLVYNLLIPIFGALCSLIVVGERQILDPMYLLSVALISLGIFLVNYTKKFKKPL